MCQADGVTFEAADLPDQCVRGLYEDRPRILLQTRATGLDNGRLARRSGQESSPLFVLWGRLLRSILCFAENLWKTPYQDLRGRLRLVFVKGCLP